MKYAKKLYNLDFLISLNFVSPKLRFLALFCCFSILRSILYLGHFIRPQSMLERHFQINWHPRLQVSNYAIKWPLVAFLVLEFDLKSFSTLLGPNDLKEMKKIQKFGAIAVVAFDQAFMTFMTFFGLLYHFDAT